MNAEGESQSVREAKLQRIVVQLELALAELDELGLSRVAISLNETIEFARAAQIPLRTGPDHRRLTP